MSPFCDHHNIHWAIQGKYGALGQAARRASGRLCGSKRGHLGGEKKGLLLPIMEHLKQLSSVEMQKGKKMFSSGIFLFNYYLNVFEKEIKPWAWRVFKCSRLKAYIHILGIQNIYFLTFHKDNNCIAFHIFSPFTKPFFKLVWNFCKDVSWFR